MADLHDCYRLHMNSTRLLSKIDTLINIVMDAIIVKEDSMKQCRLRYNASIVFNKIVIK
jgi:hypothetical protein